MGELTYGTEVIEKMNPVMFKMKGEGRRTRWGFYAQDLKNLVEEDLNLSEDDHSLVTMGENDLLSIAPLELIAVLIKGHQELSARVRELESKLN